MITATAKSQSLTKTEISNIKKQVNVQYYGGWFGPIHYRPITDRQIKEIEKSLKFGRPFNLSYTLAATGGVESSFAERNQLERVVKGREYSLGKYGARMSTGLSRRPDLSRFDIQNRLLDPTDQLADSLAIEELLFWDKSWGRKGYDGYQQWKKSTVSYNIGYGNQSNRQTLIRFYKIVALINILKREFPGYE